MRFGARFKAELDGEGLAAIPADVQVRCRVIVVVRGAELPSHHELWGARVGHYPVENLGVEGTAEGIIGLEQGHTIQSVQRHRINPIFGVGMR